MAFSKTFLRSCTFLAFSYFIHFHFTINSDSLDRNEVVHLFAFVVSVYVLQESDTLRLAINNCTGDYQINNVNANALQSSASFDEMALSMQKLVQMSSVLYPFHPGDALLDTSYKTFLSTNFVVSLVNNREMVFPHTFSFTDNQGDTQGSFTASFKGRKFSDDFTASLGLFNVNSTNNNSHCFSMLHQFNKEKEINAVGSTNSITEREFNWEKFLIVNFPSSDDGISSFLYQNRSAYTLYTNGNGFPVEKLTTVALSNTKDLFVDTTVSSAIETHSLGLTMGFNVNSGVTIDYSISNGGSALTGTVEAQY